jgi:hypothetical protein
MIIMAEEMSWKLRHWPALLSLGTTAGTAGLLTYYGSVLPAMSVPELIVPLALFGGIVGYEAGKSEQPQMIMEEKKEKKLSEVV